jgi:hypothetical protein
MVEYTVLESLSQRHGSADPDPDPHTKCHGSGTLIIIQYRE